MKGGWGQAWQQPERGIPGLAQALSEAFAPIADEEPEVLEIVRKSQSKLNRVAEKYKEDERLKQKVSPTSAKALVEEFVEHSMGIISAAAYEKPWFSKVSFSNVLLMMVLHTFQGSKIFYRVLKPQVVKYIEEGFFKWQEEERITACIAQAVAVSGITASFQDKARKALAKGYDEAHFNAPYGSTTNDSPELAVLQDFVKGWMTEFVAKGWDVLENGLGGEGETDRSRMVSVLATLFQNLLDPNVACMPSDIATEVSNVLGGLPASPWPFVDEAAAAVYAQAEAAAQPKAKKARH